MPRLSVVSRSIAVMALTLDGNSKKGALLQSEISNLICLRHLFRSRAVTKKRPIFLHARIHYRQTIYFKNLEIRYIDSFNAKHDIIIIQCRV